MDRRRDWLKKVLKLLGLLVAPAPPTNLNAQTVTACTGLDVEACPVFQHCQVPILISSSSGLLFNPKTQTYPATAIANLQMKACSICGTVYVTDVEKLWG